VVALDKQLQHRDEFLTEIPERLLQAQDYMKNYYDQGHRALEFQEGDWVWLRLHQRSAAAIRDKAAGKLAPRYYGPFQVTERVGPLAYRLRLPAKAHIHDVFHVVFLKKFEGDAPSTVAPLPPVLHGRAIPIPAKVVRVRPTLDSWELLVRWVDRDAGDATWEQLDQFKDSYPDFKLEDELFCQKGGSVMDSFFGKQFRRRNKEKDKIVNCNML
jgi:hypothetical protein